MYPLISSNASVAFSTPVMENMYKIYIIEMCTYFNPSYVDKHVYYALSRQDEKHS
jgi:hypothetical protein